MEKNPFHGKRYPHPSNDELDSELFQPARAIYETHVQSDGLFGPIIARRFIDLSCECLELVWNESFFDNGKEVSFDNFFHHNKSFQAHLHYARMMMKEPDYFHGNDSLDRDVAFIQEYPLFDIQKGEEYNGSSFIQKIKSLGEARNLELTTIYGDRDFCLLTNLGLFLESRMTSRKAQINFKENQRKREHDKTLHSYGQLYQVLKRP